MTRRRWRTLTSERPFSPERECEQFRMRLRQDLLKRVQEGWLLRYGWKASRPDFSWLRSVTRIGFGQFTKEIFASLWLIWSRCCSRADNVSTLSKRSNSVRN